MGFDAGQLSSNERTRSARRRTIGARIEAKLPGRRARRDSFTCTPTSRKTPISSALSPADATSAEQTPTKSNVPSDKSAIQVEQEKQEKSVTVKFGAGAPSLYIVMSPAEVEGGASCAIGAKLDGLLPTVVDRVPAFLHDHVRVGDILVEVNGRDVQAMPFLQTIGLFNNLDEVQRVSANHPEPPSLPMVAEMDPQQILLAEIPVSATGGDGGKTGGWRKGGHPSPWRPGYRAGQGGEQQPGAGGASLMEDRPMTQGVSTPSRTVWSASVKKKAQREDSGFWGSVPSRLRSSMSPRGIGFSTRSSPRVPTPREREINASPPQAPPVGLPVVVELPQTVRAPWAGMAPTVSPCGDGEGCSFMLGDGEGESGDGDRSSGSGGGRATEAEGRKGVLVQSARGHVQGPLTVIPAPLTTLRFASKRSLPLCLKGVEGCENGNEGKSRGGREEEEEEEGEVMGLKIEVGLEFGESASTRGRGQISSEDTDELSRVGSGRSGSDRSLASGSAGGSGQGCRSSMAHMERLSRPEAFPVTVPGGERGGATCLPATLVAGDMENAGEAGGSEVQVIGELVVATEGVEVSQATPQSPELLDSLDLQLLGIEGNSMAAGDGCWGRGGMGGKGLQVIPQMVPLGEAQLVEFLRQGGKQGWPWVGKEIVWAEYVTLSGRHRWMRGEGMCHAILLTEGGLFILEISELAVAQCAVPASCSSLEAARRLSLRQKLERKNPSEEAGAGRTRGGEGVGHTRHESRGGSPAPPPPPLSCPPLPAQPPLPTQGWFIHLVPGDVKSISAPEEDEGGGYSTVSDVSDVSDVSTAGALPAAARARRRGSRGHGKDPSWWAGGGDGGNGAGEIVGGRGGVRRQAGRGERRDVVVHGRGGGCVWLECATPCRRSRLVDVIVAWHRVEMSGEEDLLEVDRETEAEVVLRARGGGEEGRKGKGKGKGRHSIRHMNSLLENRTGCTW